MEKDDKGSSANVREEKLSDARVGRKDVEKKKKVEKNDDRKRGRGGPALGGKVKLVAFRKTEKKKKAYPALRRLQRNTHGRRGKRRVAKNRPSLLSAQKRRSLV